MAMEAMPEPISKTGIRIAGGEHVFDGTKSGDDDGYAAINAALQPKPVNYLRELGVERDPS